MNMHQCFPSVPIFSSAFLQVDVLESSTEAPPAAVLLPDGEEEMVLHWGSLT